MHGRSPTRSAIPAARMESARRFRERFLQMWQGMAEVPPAMDDPTTTKEEQQTASAYVMLEDPHDATVEMDLADAAQGASHEVEDELYRLTPGLHEAAVVERAQFEANRLSPNQSPNEEPWQMTESAAGHAEPKPDQDWRTFPPVLQQETEKTHHPTFHSTGTQTQDFTAEEKTEPKRSPSVIKEEEQVRPDERDAQHADLLARHLLPSAVFISSQNITRDPRRLLFILELPEEELLKRRSIYGCTQLASSCTRAWGDQISVCSTQHNDWTYSVLFESARKANESEGMMVMLFGCTVQAERPPPHSPCSFFWCEDHDRVDDRDMVTAMQDNFPEYAHGPCKLYRQGMGKRKEFVISFETCPQLLRIGVPLLLRNGEIIWAWFKARSPYEDCRICGKRHAARCLSRAERLI
ncbi:hypothetical protein CKM354_001283900 [Cercospora kikuchii]|uniref:Uncharacterized protein n=1 Tax=Cercospora kikuchii TaxID=84275 RepID=A0A9P3FMR0_9PEZI|nr:uncharacterized protein CKM354_001283900 [Cercospora kikuchii]GIZ49814.1 hypothetical protein CKM354_001283900 [Cercospora kikuchii]